jgi:hypothetical protein
MFPFLKNDEPEFVSFGNFHCFLESQPVYPELHTGFQLFG